MNSLRAAVPAPSRASPVETLSGSDGAIGLRDIKGEGGVAIAQAPSDAEYDGMPRAAIATDQVDFVLPAAQIPAKQVYSPPMAAITTATYDVDMVKVQFEIGTVQQAGGIRRTQPASRRLSMTTSTIHQ